MTPADRILKKALVASPIPSKDWEKVRAGLRDRAFFSSRVESLRLLREARGRTASLLQAARRGDGALETRASAVSAVMRAAREEGLSDGSGRLTDPGSARRAALVVDTNAGLAASRARFEADSSPGALRAFPCRELVRLARPKGKPRDWAARWQAAGGKIYEGGRMVAPLGDPVWEKISRFGLPYPPFDFGSHMGVRAVARAECLRLGAVPPGWEPPEKSPAESLEDRLDTDLKWANDGDWEKLKDDFGDQVRKVGDRIEWRANLVSAAFKSGEPFAIRLGSATPELLSRLPPEVPPSLLAGKKLTVTSGDWLDRKRAAGGDHRGHFGAAETDPRNAPLSVEDLDLIPQIWRNPDRVSARTSKKGRILLELDALDGSGTYKAVVDVAAQPRFVTLFKTKPPAATSGRWVRA